MAAAVKKAVRLAALVDELGSVKAELAELKAKEDALKAELLAAGVPEADGDLYHATVSYTERNNVDWKGLKEEYHPPKFLEAVEKFSKVSVVPTVRVYSR